MQLVVDKDDDDEPAATEVPADSCCGGSGFGPRDWMGEEAKSSLKDLTAALIYKKAELESLVCVI